MITLVWRTDAHLADEPPQSRTDDWARTILGKVEQVGDIAREVKAQLVLDGGDFFHVKSPSRNSHELVRRATASHQGYPCPVYATIGNHDVKYGSMEFLGESPLAVLFESGVFGRLYDQHEVFIGPAVGNPETVRVHPFNRTTGVWSKGQPAKADKYPLVRVVGVPYHGAQYDMNRFRVIQKGPEDWLVAVVHCLSSSRGGTMFEGEDILRYSDMANMAPDMWLMAHWHKNQGCEKIGPDKWVVNIGSLSRGALTQDDLTRIPEVAILKFTKTEMTVTPRPLVVAPATEVFNVTGRARAEAREMTIDAFVGNLRTALAKKPANSLLDALRTCDAPDAVRERALGYLEKAGAR